MEDHKLFDGEYRFACIVWELEPIASPDLVKACAQRLGWKKSTTYTVLRKLCQRGILRNENTVVTSLIKREQIQRYESEALLSRSFDGSLPLFVASFLRGKRLSAEEAEEIKRLIEEATK